jgi:hypothetical protein
VTKQQADDLVASAWLWLGERFQRLSEPKPKVSGPRWTEFEAAIDNAADTDRLRAAVRQYCKHALTVFKAHEIDNTEVA